MAERIVAVAYSGGRDSTALLHATLAAAAPLSVHVVALHVHHGLSPNADAWLAHCDAQCARWARRGHPLTFAAQRLATQPARGESVEAWARSARYAALAEMALAHGATLVLLAQHRRDQAETFLLQALRGAGVAGLAGMPRGVERAGIVWQR
ncbi:MAG TPA: tRNA lysidine(34) synthetase TilS, partial [Burkholderiaceae bacterium]|nr:tRNA lysidine(34) synthetase TilS [Burkholderiaceae bacterium]